MASKAKMCANKDSFYSKDRAEASAARWGQRVYECPICFCWHCTSKHDWRELYIDVTEHESILRKIKTEYNALLAEKNRRISVLELAIKKAKKGGE